MDFPKSLMQPIGDFNSCLVNRMWNLSLGNPRLKFKEVHMILQGYHLAEWFIWCRPCIADCGLVIPNLERIKPNWHRMPISIVSLLKQDSLLACSDLLQDLQLWPDDLVLRRRRQIIFMAQNILFSFWRRNLSITLFCFNIRPQLRKKEFPEHVQMDEGR